MTIGMSTNIEMVTEKDERGRDRWEEPEAGTEVHLKVIDNETDSHSQSQRDRDKETEGEGQCQSGGRGQGENQRVGSDCQAGVPSQDKCGLTLCPDDLP